MLIASHCKSIVGTEFFKPVFGCLDLSRFRRNCPVLTDALWLEAGIRRCLGLFQSGRDFLQDLSERHDTEILLTTFFESLKSKRRLALLYKSRWDVEKVFDEFKNKLGETKSWASTPNAKTCQARLLCLTHNLTLMEERISRECGIRNETETKRKAKMLVKRDEHSKSQGCGGLTVLQQCIQRLTQRTVKFIRWLKNHLDSKRSWQHSLARLDRIYARS